MWVSSRTMVASDQSISFAQNAATLLVHAPHASKNQKWSEPENNPSQAELGHTGDAACRLQQYSEVCKLPEGHPCDVMSVNVLHSLATDNVTERREILSHLERKIRFDIPDLVSHSPSFQIKMEVRVHSVRERPQLGLSSHAVTSPCFGHELLPPPPWSRAIACRYFPGQRPSLSSLTMSQRSFQWQEPQACTTHVAGLSRVGTPSARTQTPP
jgi:hypothetical protein